MDGLSNLLKSRRALSGLGQVALANAAGVSLPTIQNLEAGRGNPSVQTLEALFKVLGLRLEPTEAPVDWKRLAALGVPISVGADDGSSLIGFVPSATQLAEQLRLVAFELRAAKPKFALLRETEAVEATLLALHAHYPRFYAKYCETCPVLQERMPKRIEARHLKLRRLALAGLARYL